jgi:O-antigen ligase
MIPGLERTLYLLLALLVATLPFEFQSFPVLSNLQWTFVAIVAVGIPIAIRERKKLMHDRLVLAALAFVLVQWAAALLAPEFNGNAVKGAIRTTVGLTLLCAVLCTRNRRGLMSTFAVSSILAAFYGILDYAGLAIPHLFHEADFYAGAISRLSGSFEYPTTAAAFFALSLPVVWASGLSRWVRVGGCLALWSALILTYSRGAPAALLVMLLVWAVTAESRSPLRLCLMCVGCLLVVLLLHPLASQRFAQLRQPKFMAAQYEPEFNVLRRAPNEVGSLVLRIRNTGTETWVSTSDHPFKLIYRWYDAEKKRLVWEAPDYTPIPGPLRPQDSTAIRVSFVTPSEPGLYLLTWDIFNRRSRWFSARGVYPGLAEVAVRPGEEAWSGTGDVSRWFQRDTSRLFVANVPFSRTELWRAAWGMIGEHPFLGVGPDNFRLLYGRQYHLSNWDTKIRSNNLYLELLAGSGFAGLASFCIMMGSARWSASAASVALGVFLIHGLVDVFFMTTPIYFAFWILLGQGHTNEMIEPG